MVDYKDTKKYELVPDAEVDVYVGIPAQVDYSGKSKRIDDNFTTIATTISSDPSIVYHKGDGLLLDTSTHTFSVDFTDTVSSTVSSTKVPRGNHTHSYNSLTDTLTAGDNITITNNVIAATDTTYGAATTTTAGLMSATDKVKLDGIEAEANNFVLSAATTSALGGVKVDGDTISINNGTISVDFTKCSTVTTTANGLMLYTDKVKLDTISTSANYIHTSVNNGYVAVDSNGAELKVYELPKATASVLGGVKIGSGVNVTTDGVISVPPTTYTLPPATATSLGGILLGSNLSITTTGVLNAIENKVLKSNNENISGLTITHSLDPADYSDTFSLTPATSSIIGGIKIGTGVKMTTSTGSTTSDVLTLTPATSSSIGGIKVGAGLSMTALSSSSDYDTLNVLPATSVTIGGVKVDNYGLEMIALAGTTTQDVLRLKLATASTVGGAKVGAGLEMVATAGTTTPLDTLNLKTASTSQLGGVKVGDGLEMNPDATDTLRLKIATTSALGGVIPDGDTILIDANGKITATTGGGGGGTTYIAGEGLNLNSSDHSFNVKYDNTSIGLNGSNQLYVIGGTGTTYQAGTGILFDTSVSPNTINLRTAAANELGGVKVGTGLVMTAASGSTTNDILTVKPATSTELGGVKVASNSGLEMKQNTSSDPYDLLWLKPATSSSIGGVKVGTGLAMDTSDTSQINLVKATDGDGTYTSGSLGGVIPDGITIATDSNTGLLTIKPPTASTIGGVKAGTNITIDSTGTISSTGGGASSLEDLTDVTIGTKSEHDILIYENVGTEETPSYTWKNKVLSLSTLPDVILGTTTAEGSTLTWSRTIGSWKAEKLVIPSIGTSSSISATSDAQGAYTLAVRLSGTTGNVLSIESDGLFCAGGGTVTVPEATTGVTGGIRADSISAVAGLECKILKNSSLDTNYRLYCPDAVSLTAFNSHISNNVIHISSSERTTWNDHIDDSTIHITSSERTTWTAKQAKLVAGDGTSIASSGNAVDINTGGGLVIDSTSNKLKLEAATVSTLGGVVAATRDSSTDTVECKIDSTSHKLYCAAGGSGTSYQAGDGILFDTSASPTSIKANIDNSTITVNSSGQLVSNGSGGTVYDSSTRSLRSAGCNHRDAGYMSVDLVAEDNTNYGVAGGYSVLIGSLESSIDSLSSSSVILGGQNNIVCDMNHYTGSSNIIGSDNCSVYGTHSSILGSYNSTINSDDSVILGSYNSSLPASATYSCLAGSVYGTTNQKGVIANSYNAVTESGSTTLLGNSHSGFKGARVRTASGSPSDAETLLYISTTDVAVVHLQFIARTDSSNYMYVGAANIKVQYGWITEYESWGDYSSVGFSMDNGMLYIQNIASQQGEAEVGVWYTLYTKSGGGSSSSSS